MRPADIAPCPDNCRRCIDACPTKALNEPYSTNSAACITFLNSMDACLPDRPYNRQMGGWIYGCDACQNACPFNRQTWDSGQDFPGLQQLAEWISLENIIAADYDFLRRVMTSKFWYIGVDDGWKWKNNALNAICNHYDERFRKSIKSACRDEHPHVRDMARWVALSVGA